MGGRRGWKKQIIYRLTRDKSRCSRCTVLQRLASQGLSTAAAADRIRQHTRQPWAKDAGAGVQSCDTLYYAHQYKNIYTRARTAGCCGDLRRRIRRGPSGGEGWMQRDGRCGPAWGSQPRRCCRRKLCVHIKRCKALRPLPRLVRDLWPEISGSQQCGRGIYMRARRSQREGYRAYPSRQRLTRQKRPYPDLWPPVNHPHRNIICIIYYIAARVM